MTIEAYIKQLELRFEYCFTRAEAQAALGLSGATLNRALYRQSRKKRIQSIRRGIYLILPVKYQLQQVLPLELFIDQLATKMQKSYYVGLHSAALRHGASHQAVMEHYVITQRPQPRNADKKQMRIKFYETSKWPDKNIQKMKSDSGYYNISSPALTMADLIHFQNKAGGYNRIYTTLDELKDALTANDIKQLCTWYPYKSVLQRMGFMLASLQVEQECLLELKNRLDNENLKATLLVEQKGQRPGSVDPVWKIDQNVTLESDL